MISGTNNYNENLTYDLRGNIQTLQRTGFYQNGGTCTYGQIDNLSYSYSPNTNRLHKVLDGTTTAGDAKSRGFNGNLSTADNSMAYDRNGNLNKNLHKNVSTITYNHLNLPTVITFTTGNTIEFLYDAAGMKLRKTVKVGATVQYVQDYLSGGVEYRQNGTGVKRVESVNHAEGRYYNTNVDANNTISWRREYNIKDHLGNTRLVFTDRNANGVVDITGTASTSDVLQENHYYAFGLPFEGAWLQNDAAARDNKYQYNGKEFNDDFGLNWNDYGARWYDASVGRWNSVDALAEKIFQEGPFNYVSNNPLKYLDPDGNYKYPANSGYESKYSVLTNYLKNGIGDLLKQKDIRDGLKIIGSFSDAQIDNELSKFGDGIELIIKALDDDQPGSGELNGETENTHINIDQTLAQQLQDAKTPEDKQAALLAIISTILHETTHWGLNYNEVPMIVYSRDISAGKWRRSYNRPKNQYTYYYDGTDVGNSDETGYAFEYAIWNTGNWERTQDKKQGAAGMENNRKKVKRNKDEGKEDRLPKIE